MSLLSSAVLDAMVASGCSAEQIAAAVKASHSEQDAAIAAKREMAASRKRRQREREANSHAQPDNVTRTERDNAGHLPSSGSSPPEPLSTPNQPSTPPIVPPDEKRLASPELVLQSVVDPMNAKRFVDHCRGKGRRLSAQTAEEIVKALRDVRARGGNAVAAVDLAIKRGWTTIDVEWLANAGFKFGIGPDSLAKPIDWGPRMSVWQANGTWTHAWGPKPGERGCEVPPELLREIAA